MRAYLANNSNLAELCRVSGNGGGANQSNCQGQLRFDVVIEK